MQLQVDEQIRRTIQVKIPGRLDIVSAPEVKEQLERYLAEGVTDFVIDLSETPFMDSAGLAVLVSLLRRCRNQGGTVKLVWPRSEHVQRTLTLTRFDQVFDIIGRESAG
ncbi:STAS domain-containing protein [Litorilinea aerophila]|nr:STAS domain-containing protein [Litorilinea aerophila]MCC9074827.1 STAS domain-containing protein [Litorilinea aerophila]GIV77849.1 MAG: putative anti-sigma factor antagonist [Litorilinea sp.]